MGYAELLLRLFVRTRLWLAVLFSGCLVPVLVVASSLRRAAINDVVGYVAAVAADAASPTILLLAAAWGVNLTALAIHEEKRARRSRLLRVARVDGLRAAGPFLLVGFCTVAAVTLTGYLCCGLAAVQRGEEFSPWMRSAAAGTLYLTWIAPIGVLGGYLLPRIIALLVLNVLAVGAAFLVAPEVAARGWMGASFGPPVLLAATHLATLPLISLLWRKTSARLW